MKRAGWEQVLLGVGVVALLASVAGFVAADHAAQRKSRRPAVDRIRHAAGYGRIDLDPSLPPLRIWRAPEPQSRGAGWVYDAFTPPEVSYDARRQEFTAVPPRTSQDTVESEFELVTVRPEPFRLQLRGYVGTEGNCQGVFENVTTGEITLAGAGQIVPALGLAVTEFRVDRLETGSDGGSGWSPAVAAATVHDGLTGQAALLREGEICYAGALTAIVAATGEDDAKTLELREGEEFRSSDRTYRVERLQLDPPRAVLLQKSGPAAEPARLTLGLRENAFATTNP